MALTKVSRGLLSTSIVDNGNATAITIDANENVGIGTSSPDVFSRGYTGTITGISSASGETALMLNSSGTNVTALEMGRAGTRELLLYDTPTASQLFSLTSKPLAFGTAGAERMRIDSNGNLLVGTTDSSGDTANDNPVVAGNFTTKYGVTSITSTGTWTTVHTFGSNQGNFMVSMRASGTGNTDHNSVSLVAINTTNTISTPLLAGSSVQIRIVGLSLQVLQNVFAGANINWSIMSIGN